MSRPSEKQLMRDALQLTEGNLSSLIAARYTGTSAPAFVEVAIIWRDSVRRALGHSVQERECICPRCGIRHGIKPVHGDF